MAITKTARLGLTRWSDDADPWNRDDFDDDNAALENLVAMADQGSFLSRPAPGKRGRFYVIVNNPAAGDDGELYYDTGTKWIALRLSTQTSNLTAWNAGIASTGTGSRAIRHSSGMVTVHFNAITSAAIANNVVGGLATVPVSMRPEFSTPAQVNRSGTDTTPTELRVSPAGVISSFHNLASGTTVSGSITYPSTGT